MAGDLPGCNFTSVCAQEAVQCSFPLTNIGNFAPPGLSCDINAQTRLALTILSSLSWFLALLLCVKAWVGLVRSSPGMLKLERTKLRLFIWGTGWFLAWHLVELVGEKFIGVHWEAGLCFFIAALSLLYLFMIHYPRTKAGDSLLPFAIEGISTLRRKRIIHASFRVMFVLCCGLFSFPFFQALNLPPFAADYLTFVQLGYAFAALLFTYQSLVYQFLLSVIIQHVSKLLEEHERQSHDVDTHIKDKRSTINTMLRKSKSIRIMMFIASLVFQPCIIIMAVHPAESIGRQVNAYFYPIASILVSFLVIRNSIISITLSRRTLSQLIEQHERRQSLRTLAAPASPIPVPSVDGNQADGAIETMPASVPSPQHMTIVPPPTPPSPAHAPPVRSNRMTSLVRWTSPNGKESGDGKGALGRTKKPIFSLKWVNELPKLTEEQPSLMSSSERPQTSIGSLWPSWGASRLSPTDTSKLFTITSKVSSEFIGSSDEGNTAFYDEETKSWKLVRGM